MASPRSTTRRTPSSKLTIPAAVRAEYSPRLWPAGERRCHPEALDRVEGDEAGHERGELGVAGVLELVGAGVEQEVGDVSSGHLARLRHELPRGVVDPCRPEARALGALAGEGERDHRPSDRLASSPVTSGRGAHPLRTRQRTAACPRHPGAEPHEEHHVAVVHPVALEGVGECEGDRRRGGVPQALDHQRHPLARDAEAIEAGLEDAGVGLVGHHEGDVGGRQRPARSSEAVLEPTIASTAWANTAGPSMRR